MTDIPNEPWYACLPACEARVPCGQGRHVVRWEAGSLRLDAHTDPEAELVLAALGGEKARCIELAETWGRHTADLSVLAVGPREEADEIGIGWDDVAAAQASQPGGTVIQGLHGTTIRYGPGQAWHGPAQLPTGSLPPVPTSLPPGSLRPVPASLPPGLPSGVPASVLGRRRRAQEELEEVRRRRTDMLSLLALGYGFQVRLAGQVVAAHAEHAHDGEGHARPALAAAMTGRLAPVAERWLGIDPDQVVVALHGGPGWGAVEMTGRGEQRRLRIALPAWWLARVWACGLALVGRHLVVAVERPGWPRARVLGLRTPGAEPEPLDVHGRVDEAGAGDDGPGHAPHWKV